MKMIQTAAALILSAVLAVPALAGAPFAEVAESGQSLVVPDEHAGLGTVYYALSGRDRQIYFTSDAPLEKIKGQSNLVIGYAVAGPSAEPAALQAGEWHLPIKSMRTGIKMRDEHLAGKDWLDAKNNPDIVFQIIETTNVKAGKSGSGFKTYTATLVGDMSIRGVTRRMAVPASITLMSASDATGKIATGDLLAIRASYSVTLKDFGVSHPVIGDKVAPTVDIDTILYLSTVPPEEQ